MPSPHSTSPANSLPESIGKYRIKRLIARGSMGDVYEAYDQFVQRPVAIKASRAQLGSSATERFDKAFFREARTAGNLHHPHIVGVYDAGMEGDRSYIVMEYVAGRTLTQHTRAEHRLSVDKVIDVIFKCCKALDYAHRRGVVHRDIKPSNIMITDQGEVKIVDFGVARLEKQTEALPAGLVGSPDYMSPEQVNNEPVTNESDLYSLGAVMYQLLTARLPFNASNLHSLIYQIIHTPSPSLQLERPELPASLVAIVDKALAKHPANRYISGQAFAEDLSRLFDALKHLDHQIDRSEHRQRMTSLLFFQAFRPSDLDELLRIAHWVDFNMGATIIDEDNIDNTFHVVINGMAELFKGGRSIGFIYKGDCFGEVGLISTQRHNIRVVARSFVTLMRVNASLIEQTSEHCQARYYKAITTALIKRLAEAGNSTPDCRRVSDT